MKKSLLGLLIAVGAMFFGCAETQKASLENGANATAQSKGRSIAQAAGEVQEPPSLSLQQQQLLSDWSMTRLLDHLPPDATEAKTIKNSPDKLKLDRWRELAKDKSRVDRLNRDSLDIYQGPLKEVLHHLFINQKFATANADIIRGGIDRTAGKSDIRVVSWNIERGQRLDRIKEMLGFRDPATCLQNVTAFYNQFLNDKGEKYSDPKYSADFETAKKELCALNEADVLFLNEADYGVCRSGNKFVAQEIADQLNMNLAYAPSFLEIEPSKVGLAPNTDKYCKNKNSETGLVNPQHLNNLSGNAILSRFPMSNVEVVPLPKGFIDEDGNPTFRSDGKAGKGHSSTENGSKPNFAYCWNWHGDEYESATLPDRAKSAASKLVFKEEIVRELRRGGRNSIIADIKVPDGRGGFKDVTLVNAHFENMADGKCRATQLKYLMNIVEKRNSEKNYPIVFGGDFNTTGLDGSRLTIKDVVVHQLKGQIGNPSNWEQIAGVAAPFGVNQAYSVGKFAFSTLRNFHNPSHKDLCLFHLGFLCLSHSEEFRFFDLLTKKHFVKSGKQFSADGNDHGAWSATNAREPFDPIKKSGGFEPTHFAERVILYWGMMKLDWLFLKNPNSDKCLSPHDPRTLNRMKDGMLDEYPSDHVPVTSMFSLECLQQ